MVEPSQQPAPSTGQQWVQKLVDAGLEPAAAKAELDKALGFAVSPEQLRLTSTELKKRAAEILRRKREPVMSRDDTLFAPSKPGRGIVQGLGVPVAQAAGAISFLFSNPTEAEKQEIFDAFRNTREQLQKETDHRMTKGAYANFRSNVSDLSEGTVDFLIQLAGMKSKGGQGDLEALTGAFKEGRALPGALMGGMAAFLTQLATDKRMFYTHPADAWMTVLPILPKLGPLVKARNAKAIKALRELEETGVLRSVAGGDVAEMAVKGARKAMEAPGRVLDAPLPGPFQSKVRSVVEMGPEGPTGGARQRTFGDLAKGALSGAGVGIMVDETLLGATLGASPAILSPAVQAIKQYRPEIMDAARRVDSKLGKAQISGAEGVARSVMGLVDGLDEPLLRRWLTDISAHSNARAEALLRQAALEPELFAKWVAANADELLEYASEIDTSKLEPAPYKPELGSTAVTFRDPTGVTIPWKEEALRREIAADRFDPAKNPLVAKLSEEGTKSLDAIMGRFQMGLARAREDLAPGVTPQIDKTAMYATQIREVLTGDAPGLVADPVVNGAVMKYLVDLGMTPADAGAQLRLAESEWLAGRRVEARIGIPPKGWTKEKVARMAEARRVIEARTKLTKKLGRNPDLLELAEAAGVAEAEVGSLLSLIDDRRIPWTEVDLNDVIVRAVAKSPEAQKKVLKNLVAKISRDEGKNQRVRIIADTANPVLDIFEERWLKEGGTDAKGNRRSFDWMLTSKPEVFSDIVMKMYELDKGLTPGAPVMFLPLQPSGLTPPNITSNLQGRHLDMVARALSKKHGMSFGAAKRELTALKDKIFKLEKVDDLGGYLDPTVAKAFNRIDAAENFRNDMSKEITGYVNRGTSKLKKNLTVLNVSSGINNITANILLQSISRGVPMSVIVKELATSGLEFRKFKNKALTDPSTIRMYKSLENSGILDSDMIAVETHLYKGDTLSSKLAKPFEEFYRQGDALPKLEDSIRTYKKVMTELDMLKTGEGVSLMVDSNTVVPLKRSADGFTLNGELLSPDRLADLVGRGAAMAAENKFFNYADTGALSRALRASGAMTAVSPFYTWFSKALAGRRGGLVGNVMKGDFSPIVATDSVAILRKQLGDATLQSGRRAAFTQAGDIEDRANKGLMRGALSYEGEHPGMLTEMKGDIAGHKSLQYIDFSGPFSLGLRGALGLLSIGRGDTKVENLDKLLRSNSPEDKRRASLALRQLRGDRFTLKDSMELLGLAGGPALELMEAFRDDAKDKYGRPRPINQLIATFGAALFGGTLAKGVQTAFAVGPETGIWPGSLPTGVGLDPERRETVMSFAVRRMLGILPRPVRLLSKSRRKYKSTKSGIKAGEPKVTEKSEIDYHIEAINKALRGGTIGALNREIKRLGKAGRQEDKVRAKALKEEVKMWDKIITAEVKAERVLLKKAVSRLQKRSKKAQ